MAITPPLPIVGDSEGTWGTTLNQGLTDMDNRLVAAIANIGSPYNNASSLDARVVVLEAKTAVPAFADFTALCAGMNANNGDAPDKIPAGSVAYDKATNVRWTWTPMASAGYWTPPPGQLVHKIGQSVADPVPHSGASFTALNWQTAASGYYTLAPIASMPTAKQFKPTVPGWYEMSGVVSFAVNPDSFRSTAWGFNSEVTAMAGSISSASATPTTLSSVNARTMPIKFNGSSDYVTLMAMQYSGVSLNTGANGVSGNTNPAMIAKWVSAP